MKALALIFAPLVLSGCHATTLTARGENPPLRAPDFDESKSFLLLGLVGEGEIKVRDVCGNNKAEGIRAWISPGDFIKTLITIGIYAPKTAQVWCLEGKR